MRAEAAHRMGHPKSFWGAALGNVPTQANSGLECGTRLIWMDGGERRKQSFASLRMTSVAVWDARLFVEERPDEIENVLSDEGVAFGGGVDAVGLNGSGDVVDVVV
jgi:hypothetical protein